MKGAQSTRTQPGPSGTVELGTALVLGLGVVAAVGGAFLMVHVGIHLGGSGEKTALESQTELAAQSVRLVQVQAFKSPSGFTLLKELVEPSATAHEVDLRLLQLRLTVGDRQVMFAYGTALAPSTFTAVAVRDDDGSFQPAEPILTGNDLVQLTIDLGLHQLALDDRNSLVQEQVLENGGAVRSVLRLDPDASTRTIAPLELLR